MGSHLSISRSEISKWSATYPGSMDGPPDPLFSLAPDWVFRAPSVTLRAVSSYLTLSPLPRQVGAVYFLWHCPSRGPSDPHALIFMRNPALWCPDFPLPARGPTAGARQPVDWRAFSKFALWQSQFVQHRPPRGGATTGRNRGCARRCRSGPARCPGGPKIRYRRKPSDGIPCTGWIQGAPPPVPA